MGFDIYGLAPTDEKFKYFRANCWYWRPLWSYALFVTLDLTEDEINAGADNSGSIISNETAIKIGKNILKRNKSGKLTEYSLNRKKYLLDLPLIDCYNCTKDNKLNKKTCSVCNNSRKVDNEESYYPFSVELALEFANFCKNSGGFQVY